MLQSYGSTCKSPIHLAVARGEKPTLEKYLREGHPVEAQDNGGSTILDIARDFFRKDLIKMLELCGADKRGGHGHFWDNPNAIGVENFWDIDCAVRAEMRALEERSNPTLGSAKRNAVEAQALENHRNSNNSNSSHSSSLMKR